MSDLVAQVLAERAATPDEPDPDGPRPVVDPEAIAERIIRRQNGSAA